MRSGAGTFVRWCVEKYLDTQAAPALEAALQHHARLLESGALAPELPRELLDVEATQPNWTGVRVSAPRDGLLSLEREAAREGVSADLMLTHALFVYLSALDSGELD